MYFNWWRWLCMYVRLKTFEINVSKPRLVNVNCISVWVYGKSKSFRTVCTYTVSHVQQTIMWIEVFIYNWLRRSDYCYKIICIVVGSDQNLFTKVHHVIDGLIDEYESARGMETVQSYRQQHLIIPHLEMIANVSCIIIIICIIMHIDDILASVFLLLLALCMKIINQFW